MDNSKKSNREILDEFEKKNFKKQQINSVFYKIFKYISPYRFYLLRVFIIVFVIFVVYAIFTSITSPIKYAEKETKLNALEVRHLVDIKIEAIEVKKLFIDALDLLEKYPRYYEKVVNNIQEIKIEPGLCPYACIYYTDFTSPFSFKIPEANFSQKTLVINPRGLKKFNSPEKFASLLVHETDHIEYIESSKLRRAGLFFKCNPILNPNISIFSNLPSITHRIKTMEVCAEKEQIAFHKATETESGYEIKHSFIYNSGLFLLNILKTIFKIIVSIFKSIF